jgi:hypothetical protein
MPSIASWSAWRVAISSASSILVGDHRQEGLRQVEVDVRVHAQQQPVQDGQPAPRVEGYSPGTRQLRSRQGRDQGRRTSSGLTRPAAF